MFILRNIVFKTVKNTQFILKMNSSNVSGSPTVLVEKLGTVTTIGINRPEKRNCINYSTSELLKIEIAKFEEDKEAKVGVLYGIGGNFCAGYDLGELSQLNTDIESPLMTETGTVGPTQRFIKKPLIAAVSGYAVAGGLELALMCDMRVVEDTAIMGVFCRRFGVPLIDGGTVKLPALIGLSRALDVILTGRAIEAKEALEWGLANRIVATGTALGQAVQLATSLTKFPQECMNLDRKSAFNSMFNASSLEEALRYERVNGATVITKESVQGAQKFVSGVGKHGKFHNLIEKDNIPDWEKEDSKVKSKL